MVWIPGTDYPPAQHVGYPVSVLRDGTDTSTDTDASPLRDNDAVIGWRAGCDRGWRGRQFYPHTGAVPAALEGWEGITATCGEWARHVQQIVPELSVYELARQLADTGAKLNEAVTLARRAGLSWAQIGDAAGISADHAQRWGNPPARNSHRPPPRRDGPAPRPDCGLTR
jgi:hypothetical protein